LSICTGGVASFVDAAAFLPAEDFDLAVFDVGLVFVVDCCATPVPTRNIRPNATHAIIFVIRREVLFIEFMAQPFVGM
jgi:hypothetical protein